MTTVKTILSDSVKTFDRIVSKPETDRTVSKMYKTHKYWARKPWYVVAEYINFFTKPGDKVLDVFSGSGVTGLEAIAAGRQAHIVDLNPMAGFISETTAMSVNIDALRSAFLRVKNKLARYIDGLYTTKNKCPQCKSALVGRYFLRGPVFEAIKVKEDCRNCGYSAKDARPLTKAELDEISGIEKRNIDHWHPMTKFPKQFDKNRVTYKGIEYIHQIFTRRNLLALSLLFNELGKVSDVEARKMLILAFSNTLLHVSKLKAENVRPMAVNNYWVPDDWIEENVWFRFAERFDKVLAAKRVSNARVGVCKRDELSIHTQSSTDLGFLMDESIDYCFNDPPYGDSIQYSELSMIWNAWLGNHFENAEEVIINRYQGKRAGNYQALLTKVYKEVFRVLKRGNYMTVCFHNKDINVWSALLQACKDAGFLYINAVPQKPISKSFTQAWAEKSPKTDMLMNFIKPNGESPQIPKEYAYLDEFGKLIERVIQNLDDQKTPPSLGSVYDGVLSHVVGYSFYTDDTLRAADYSMSRIKSALENYASK